MALGFLLWRRGHTTGALGAAALGGGLLLAGLFVPTRLGPFHRAWMALALAISKVTTPVAMSLVFFLVLTPAALIARLVGYRPLLRRPGAGTYWHSRPPGERRGDMNHQF